MTGGILGESPQGMPPFGLGARRLASAWSSPAADVDVDVGAGGSTVRAISRGEGVVPAGLGVLAAAPAASSLPPQPRQNL